MSISPDNVHETLARHILVDGFDFVIDLDKSSGSRFHDARTGQDILDFFSCFASMPVGWNHPDVVARQSEFGRIALNNVANSDIYTAEMAEAIETIGRITKPSYLPNMFFIAGGALAVENCLKSAMDWKSHQREQKGIDSNGKFDWRKDQESSAKITIGHFNEAFHGRSGYTLSLTNTDPTKTERFTKFDWPRFDNPTIKFPIDQPENHRLDVLEQNILDSIRTHASANPDTMAAIIIEPIQGEGGDNHFRPSFMHGLRKICDEVEALLILDEVQTGVGLTGKMWAHEHAGIEPDMIAFGKKMQVGGMMASKKMQEFDDNVFDTSSRINSTFGGNLIDMFRAATYLEIMEREDLVTNAARVGSHLKSGLQELADRHSGISNVRAAGLFQAFTMSNKEMRDDFRRRALDVGVLTLASGSDSIRLRPPLNLSQEEADQALGVFEDVITAQERISVA
jgi:L-lysine 6-transaminase